MEKIVRALTPPGESWDEWFDSPRVDHDFMRSRFAPLVQDRGVFGAASIPDSAQIEKINPEPAQPL
jgi:hypothetical protein